MRKNWANIFDFQMLTLIEKQLQPSQSNIERTTTTHFESAYNDVGRTSASQTTAINLQLDEFLHIKRLSLMIPKCF